MAMRLKPVHAVLAAALAFARPDPASVTGSAAATGTTGADAATSSTGTDAATETVVAAGRNGEPGGAVQPGAGARPSAGAHPGT